MNGNTILEKFFTSQMPARKIRSVIKEVTDESRFIITSPLYKGKLLGNGKVGSLIYKGEYKNKISVLKIQIYHMKYSESFMTKQFNKHSKSKLVRLPLIYEEKEWEEKKNYGYLISEYIPYPKIYSLASPTESDMDKFTLFYNDYKKNITAHSWFKRPSIKTFDFINERLRSWQDIAVAKKYIEKKDYYKYLLNFKKLMPKFCPKVPLVFSHGHLSANDIYQSPSGFILMSNLFWGYRPLFYDLVFHIWSNLTQVRDIHYTTKQAVTTIEIWREKFKNLTLVKKYKNFDKIFNFLLLERLTGSLLIDIGSDDIFQTRDKKYFAPMIKLFKQLHNYYYRQLI